MILRDREIRRVLDPGFLSMALPGSRSRTRLRRADEGHDYGTGVTGVNRFIRAVEVDPRGGS